MKSMRLWNNIKAKVSAAVIAAFFMGSPVGAEEFTGELRYACEAVLCLSSSTRPGECSPALNYFFNIKHKRIDKTIRKRLNFLNLCPASSETPDMENLVSALSRGSGRCDAQALNKEIRWCRGASREYHGYLHTSNIMPDYCRALHSHSYTQLPPPRYVGEETRFGYWVEAVDYERELAKYEERMRLLGNRYKGAICYR